MKEDQRARKQSSGKCIIGALVFKKIKEGIYSFGGVMIFFPDVCVGGSSRVYLCDPHFQAAVLRCSYFSLSI